MTDFRDSIIRDTVARDQIMARRLRQFYDDEQRREGLRDMRDYAMQATSDERSAAGLVVWLAIAIFGIALGVIIAHWALPDGASDRIAIATPTECAR